MNDETNNSCNSGVRFSNELLMVIDYRTLMSHEMEEQEFLDYCEDLVEKKVVKAIKNYHEYFHKLNKGEVNTSDKQLDILIDRANSAIGLYVGDDEYLLDRYSFKKCGDCVYSRADIDAQESE